MLQLEPGDRSLVFPGLAEDWSLVRLLANALVSLWVELLLCDEKSAIPLDTSGDIPIEPAACGLELGLGLSKTMPDKARPGIGTGLEDDDSEI